MPFKNPADKRAYEKRLVADGRMAAYKRKSRARPEAKALAAATEARRRTRDPERCRAQRRRAYGAVDPSGELKAGPCEICGTHADPLHYDHDHVTGAFAGWLCGNCNRAIGLMKDDAERLEKAAAYVRRTRALTGAPAGAKLL